MDSPAPLTESDFRPQSDNHRSARGAAALLGAQVFKFALQFGSQLILARMLNPAAFGLVAMVAPIWGLVLIFVDLGIAQAIVQRTDVSNSQLSTLFWVASAITGVLTLLMLLLAPFLAWLYSDARVSGIAIALSALVFISGLTIVPKSILARKMKFGTLASIDVFSATCSIAVGIALAWLNYDYWALVGAQAVNATATLLLTWICARWVPSFVFGIADVKSLLHFGADVSGVNLAIHLTGSIDNVMIGAVAGSTALGLYDRGYRLVAQPLTQFIFPIGQVAVPLLSRSLPSSSSYRDAYFTVLQFLLLVTAPGLIFGISFHTSVVEILLGPRWTEADQVVAWFCFGALVSPVYTSLSWLFTSQDRTREQLFYTGITCGITVFAVLIGLRWGAVGVAASGALSYVFLQVPLLVWAITRKGAIGMRQLLVTLFPYGLASAVSVTVLGGAKQLFSSKDIGTLSIMLCISYAIALLVLLCFRHSRAFLGRVWKAKSIFALQPDQGPL